MDIYFNMEVGGEDLRKGNIVSDNESRFKTMVEDFEMEDLLVRPKSFEFKKTKNRSIGFLSHQISEAYPSLENVLWFKPRTREGGPIKVDEIKLLPILWNKVLKLESRLKELENGKLLCND